MSTFTSALTDAPPDSSKHVNYTIGMVLGVDDFTQEFSYLSNRDRTLAGAALGTGALSGLQVTVTPGAHGRAGVVRVAPGQATSPGGQTITVSSAQCADLDEWLQASNDDVTSALGSGSPPGDLTVYVALAYATEATDAVPIPPTPNSSAASLTAASRIRDSFSLAFTTSASTQDRGQADARLADWLAQLRYAPTSNTTVQDLVTALEAAAAPASPPVWPPAAWPAPPASLVIPRSQANQYLRAALTAWVTQVRPKLATTDGDGSGDAAPDALVLAELSVPMGAGTAAAPAASGPATVVSGNQPVVLPPQLVQDLALASAVPPPEQHSIGRLVGAARFELRRESEEGEVELHAEFAQNVHAAIVPRPGSEERRHDREATVKRGEARAHEHYVRFRLEHEHEERHRYVVMALPLVEGRGARYAIEQISDPPHEGEGSHQGPFMIRLAPIDGKARSLRVGFTVQITDLGPPHPRRTS